MLRRTLAVSVLIALSRAVLADGQCRVLDVDWMPAESPAAPSLRFGIQAVAWLERASGEFVETVFITKEVGTFGLGNRPGRFDFNSGPDWPYGRRVTVLPVWAHRHGLEFPLVVFQDANDSGLSHAVDQSSPDAHYCRPLLQSEPQWDARTCASVPNTDKGRLGSGRSSYPPRSDLALMQQDDPSTTMYRTLNPFDTVSMATPLANTLAHVSWPMPDTLADGAYVLWVEVAREFDHNATYSEAAFPSPMVSFGDYGAAYRGQPSVVYRVPITIGATATVASGREFVGYGDPDGIDGAVRPPDATITTDVPGSGALRLGLISADGDMFRVRARSTLEHDSEPPAQPRDLSVINVVSSGATLSFVAPGDDGFVGHARRYELRYLVGETVTESNFDTAPELATSVPVGEPGVVTQIAIDRLLPATTYSIGVRAFDNCRNASPLAVISFTTAERKVGEVDACFVATAAYGSTLANDVEALRGFRDTVLRSNALGELAVESYYTFGPVLAGVIGQSELLRGSAREVIRPIVAQLR